MQVGYLPAFFSLNMELVMNIEWLSKGRIILGGVFVFTALIFSAMVHQKNNQYDVEKLIKQYDSPVHANRVLNDDDTEGIMVPVVDRDFEIISEIEGVPDRTIVFVGYLPNKMSYELEMAISNNEDNFVQNAIQIGYESAVGLDRWDHYARIFYTLKSVDGLSLWGVLYNDFHLNNANFSDEGTFQRYLTTQIKDQNKVNSLLGLYNSDHVDAEILRMKKMLSTIGRHEPPYLIVNGKYLVDYEKSSSVDKMLKVASILAVSK